MPSGNGTASSEGSSSRKLESGRAASRRLARGLVDADEGAMDTNGTPLLFGTGHTSATRRNPPPKHGYIDICYVGQQAESRRRRADTAEVTTQPSFAEPPQSSHR